MAADDEDIEVDIRLNDYLSASAERAARAVQQLADNLKQANRQLLVFDKRANKAADAMVKLAAATEAYNKTQRTTVTNFDSINKSVDTYNKNIKDAEQRTRGFDDHVKKAEHSTGRFHRAIGLLAVGGRAIIPVLKMMAVGMAAFGAVAGGAHLLQGLLGMVGALSNLAAFSALIPTALGALVAVMATMKIATAGVGDSLKAAFSGEATKEQLQAMRELSGGAKNFILELLGFKKDFKEFQKAVQNELFAPLSLGIKSMVSADLPILKAGMRDIAREIGLTGLDLEKFFASQQGKDTLETIFHAGKTAAMAFHDVVMPILRGVSSVIISIAPLWDDLMSKLTQKGGQFGQWLDKIATSGQLQQWLEKAMVVADQLWDIFKNVFSIIKDLISAIGTDGLSELQGLIELVAQFTNSFEGQSAIGQVFSALATSATALAPILVIIATAIGGLATPLQTIITKLAPGVTIFLQALSDAISVLAPVWGPLADAVSAVLTAVSPLLPVVGQLAKVFGLELAIAIQTVAGILGPFIQVLAPLLTQWFSMIGQVLEAVAPLIPPVFEAFSQGLSQAQPLIQAFIEAIQGQFGQFITALIPQLQQLLPMIVTLATEFGGLLAQNIAVILPQLPPLFGAIMQLAMAMLQATPALMMLIQGFINLIPLVAALLPSIGLAIGLIVRLGVAFINAVTGVMQFAHDAGAKVREFVTGLQTAFSGVATLLSGPFKAARDTIRGVADDIKGFIQGIIDKARSIGGAIKDGLSKLNPFKFMGGDVQGGKTYTVGEIGPELFIPQYGTPYMIGERGMEDRMFSSAGTIIPTFMLDAFARMEARMNSSRPQVNTAQQAAMAEAMRQGRGAVPESTTYDVDVHLHGSSASAIDVERAVGRALEKLEREKKERSYGTAGTAG